MSRQSKEEYFPALTTIAVLTAIFTLYFSIYTFSKLLPLSKSNVVFSEQEIKISQEESCVFKDETKGPCDRQMVVFKNIGKVEAEDLRFEIYTIPVACENERTNLKKCYGEYLSHNLQPGDSATIGRIDISYSANLSIGEENVEYPNFLFGRSLVLIYYLEYSDSLISDGEPERKVFFYQYTVGKMQKLFSLIDSDYIKVYDSVKRGLREYKNEWLLEYVENNPPKQD